MWAKGTPIDERRQKERRGVVKPLGKRVEGLLNEMRMELEDVGTIAGIGPEETFLSWCERLAADGLKVDGKPFTLVDRPVLRELYRLMPSKLADLARQTYVVRKSAQMGLTLMGLLYVIFLMLKHEPCAIGVFLPEMSVAQDMSGRRFANILRTIPDAYRKLTTRLDMDGETVRATEGNSMNRQLGDSSIHFLWTSSAIGTESRPMSALLLDECQGMSLEQIDRVTERLSASHIRFRLMMSTANLPGGDIDWWFAQGTKCRFFTKCQACGGESDLIAHWPECCRFNDGDIEGTPLNEYYYACPICWAPIADTQQGRFIAAEPTAKIKSFTISQILSPTITATEMMESYNRAETGDQKKSWWNRKAGTPFIDKDLLPVQMSHCLVCSTEGVRNGLTWQSGSKEPTVLGVDQMGSFLVLIVMKRLRNGMQGVIHVEAVFSHNCFDRVAQVMRDYNVECAALESLPNINDARRLANDPEFKGRVFLVNYATSPNSDMITWSDSIVRSDRKTVDELRSRWVATVQRYKAMQAALFRIKNTTCLWPDPALLEQDVVQKGEWKRVQIARDWTFEDFTRVALVIETDPATGARKPSVLKLGADPHFAFALLLVNVAWARVHGGSTFITPEDDGGRMIEAEPLVDRVERNMHGLPKFVLAMLEDGPASTCGRCQEFDLGARLCKLRGLNGAASDPSCDLFERRR